MTHRLRAIAGLAFVLCAVVACASDDLDRREAIARVVDESGGRITDEQAACYVDRVLDEIGSAPLRADAEVSPEQNARLTTLRVDCIGVVNLGAAPPTSTPASVRDGALPGPKRKGESAELDALWDACASGYGQACDALFEQAPMGSEYEDFGASCGGRTREQQCAAVYPSPGVTLPSAAQPSTTVPPASP
jgi:hypothetical protein